MRENGGREDSKAGGGSHKNETEQKYHCSLAQAVWFWHHPDCRGKTAHSVALHLMIYVHHTKKANTTSSAHRQPIHSPSPSSSKMSQHTTYHLAARTPLPSSDAIISRIGGVAIRTLHHHLSTSKVVHHTKTKRVFAPNTRRATHNQWIRIWKLNLRFSSIEAMAP